MKSTPPRQFIVDHGGAAAMARAMHVDPRTVRMWKVRNRIPRKVWPEIIATFPKVTLEQLRAVEALGD